MSNRSTGDSRSTQPPPNVTMLEHGPTNRRPELAEGTPPPTNLVPFTRPRAMAEIAAANPGALEVKPIPMKNAAAETVHIAVAEVKPQRPVPTKNVNAQTQHMPVMQMPPKGRPAATMLGMAPLPKQGRPLPVIGRAVEAPPQLPVETKPVGVTTEKVPPQDDWDDFEKMGLGRRRRLNIGSAQKLVVSSYRLLGFAILTIIVVVLVGYIATTAFYYMSSSWAAPVAISASDEKVVALKAQLAEQQNGHDRLVAELDDTDRAIAAEQDFQSEFARAIQSDLKGRQAALERVRQLASKAQSTRVQIRDAGAQYAKDHAATISKELDAGLIDRSAALSGKYQVAQIQASNLSLAERQAEFEQRAAQLANETRALDAILGGKTDVALSYDVLKIKRDYDTSKLALARTTQQRKLLQQSLVRQREILKNLQESALLRVIADKATVAQVPYENLKSVGVGTRVIACRLQMLWCHDVGKVRAVLPGEVTFQHPHRGTAVRGQLVELDLSEPDAAAKNVLFLGGAPLWL
jgi:hypothetical protein